jgi:hypothetical protein
MAKTGGSYINRFFANKFERVCGNKGHSSFYYKVNEMNKKNGNNSKEGPMTMNVFQNLSMMFDKIGFEDCDFISMEVHFSFWNNNFPGGNFYHVPIELHVPCRDPVDHMMSSCNWRGVKLDCNVTDEIFFVSLMLAALYRCFGTTTSYLVILTSSALIFASNSQHM